MSNINLQQRRSGMDMPNQQRQPMVEPRHDGSFVPAASPVSSRKVDLSSFSKFINWCLYGLVVLVPLVFLPITSEVREFNKQAVIFFLVVIMLAVWVVKILTTRSVSWVKTSLDYVILAFGLVYLLASFLSTDRVSSFLGYYGRFTGSFVSVISLVVLYYLVVNNVRTAKLTDKLMNLTIISGGIAMVYGFLQLLGVYILRFSFAKTPGFNTIGSMAALAIFSAIMVIVIQWSWLTREGISKYRHIAYGVLTLVGLANLFVINAFVAWLILALGLIVFLALALVISTDSDTSATWFWRPLLVLVVAILFVGFQFLPASINPRRLVSVNLPYEIQLSNSANWNMVKNALSSKPILGHGPGTTGIVYGEIKPESINKSIVWSLNFDRASSEVASIAIESGLLGLLVFEAASILFLLYALFFLLKKVNHPGRMQAFGFFLIWLALYITHFFYFFNTTFGFLFWFSLAMFVAVSHWQESDTESSNLSFSTSPRSALSWMFASLLILAILLVGAFFEISVYSAEIAYANGIKELNKTQPDFAKADQDFSAAISRNQYRDVYYLAYAQNLIFRASQEAAKDQPDITQFQTWISNVVAAGNSATNISPNKSSNWSARAQYYSQLRSLAIPGTNEAIIDSWQKAASHDSQNPAIQIQLALAYSNAAQSIDPQIVGDLTKDSDNDGLSDARETELKSSSSNSDSNNNGVSDGDEVKAGFNPAGAGRLDATQLSKYTKIDESYLRKAEDALKLAIDMKPDLPDSYVALARIYEQWNKLSDAEKTLADAQKLFSNNSDIVYELGRIMFNQKDYTNAENNFNTVIRIVPNHANAHYSLGLVYLQRNDKTKALGEFEKTREITGPNVDLEKVINDLKNEIANPTPTPTPPASKTPPPPPATK